MIAKEYKNPMSLFVDNTRLHFLMNIPVQVQIMINNYSRNGMNSSDIS